MPRQTIAQQLDLARRVLDAIGEDAALRARLEQLGYDADTLAQGRALYDALHGELEAVLRHGVKDGIGDCLVGWAGVIRAEQPDIAARLLGAAEALHERNSMYMWPVARAEYEQIVSAHDLLDAAQQRRSRAIRSYRSAKLLWMTMSLAISPVAVFRPCARSRVRCRRKTLKVRLTLRGLRNSPAVISSAVCAASSLI